MKKYGICFSFRFAFEQSLKNKLDKENAQTYVFYNNELLTYAENKKK